MNTSSADSSCSEPTTLPERGPTTVLLLCGSRVSAYYEGVSAYYAEKAHATLSTYDNLRHVIAKVHRDGQWSFPQDFSQKDEERVSLSEAMRVITKLAPDVVNPVMFCNPGMTSYRALFEDALGIPVIGCDGSTMALTTHKGHTRAVMSSAGVRVPEAELLRPGMRPSMRPPFVLKPAREDNSLGITLIRPGFTKEQLDTALSAAFKLDSSVLCERYIPLGREVRCAVMETGTGPESRLELLPLCEYILDSETGPIRTSATKLCTDAKGVPTAPNFAQTPKRYVKPCELEEGLRGELETMARAAHRALGCRDYSLYDVRICPEGRAYFLEACVFCSFSPTSAMIGMCEHGGRRLRDVYGLMVQRAQDRGARAGQRSTEGSVRLL